MYLLLAVEDPAPQLGHGSQRAGAPEMGSSTGKRRNRCGVKGLVLGIEILENLPILHTIRSLSQVLNTFLSIESALENKLKEKRDLY